MDTRTTIAEIAILTAAEGCVLTDGSCYAREVACRPSDIARWREIPDPGDIPPEPPARYSKLRLHRALAAAGLWDAVWGGLTDDQRAYWQEAQDLSDADPAFADALAALRAAVAAGTIVLPEGVTIEGLLEGARIDA